MARFAFGWTLPVRHQKQEKEPMPIYKNIFFARDWECASQVNESDDECNAE